VRRKAQNKTPRLHANVSSNFMKDILLVFLTLFSTMTYADIIKGKVVDLHTNEPVFAAKIRIVLHDKSVINSETNFDGTFEYSANQKTLMLITNAKGYHADTISFKQFDKNDNVILLLDKPVFICTNGELKYKDEESNPEYDYKINGQSTTNFIDSLNRRQGRWVISQNDKYDKKSKYSYGQPMSIGYYKDNFKVGKWLILSPSGTIKRKHLYNE
jgi:hypothetical protein